MSAFTPEWLSLREGVDRRSRDQGLLSAVRTRFRAARRTTVCELGAGSGSLLRALAPQLADRQEWRLLDSDPDNLAAAGSSLRAWAETAEERSGGLSLVKDGREIDVSFEERDLSGDIGQALGDATLVAASALFDLAGPAWLGRLAAALAAGRQTFYASLSYDGSFAADPSHDLDRAVALAFGAHQRSDKGLGGVAAGPTAQALLAAALRAQGAEVAEGDSSWHLTRAEHPLLERMLGDYAAVALETGLLPPAEIIAWRDRQLADCRRLSIGHSDLLASWPEAV